MLAGVDLSAQNPYIQHYTTYDGLPSNTVYYIYQDSKKFIWFATDVGVVRYDGTTFKNFRKSDGLNSNEVIRIKEDSYGRIWFFNLNGRLNFFYQNKIYNETNAPFLDSIKNKNFFTDFYQDHDNIIYFYNWWFEIFALTPQNNVINEEKVIKSIVKFKYIFNGCLRYLLKNSKGEFMIWANSRIFKLNISFKNSTIILDSVWMSGVFPGRNKSYYISAYQYGIFKINNEFQIESISMPFKMPDKYMGIKSILEDADGFLWIVTYDKGVFYLRNNQIIHHFDIKEGQSIIQDNENNIWISSMKDGVYKLSPYLNVLRHYESPLFQNSGITGLDANPGVGLWFTNGKLVYLLKNNNLYTLNFQIENYPFTQILQLKNNTLILGGNSSFSYALEGIAINYLTKKITYKTLTKTKQTTKKIAINKKEDKVNIFGDIFVFIYNINKRFQDFKEIDMGEHTYNTFYNLHDDLIINAKKNYLYRDEKLTPCKELSCFDNKIITDHLILNPSTELYNIDGDNLYLYDQHDFWNLTAAFGSPIDLQVKKVVYEEPTLYLATYRNIYKCDNPLQIFENKPVQLQLLDINFRNIHDILVNNDSLYIASDDGLTIIPEVSINKITTHTPIPYFQSILINDKEKDPSGRELVIRGNNKITFNFSCINYSSTPILYSYRLKGMDTAWTTGTFRNVVYQNPTWGKYLFQLRVRKPSAGWSKTVEWKITVRAQFWQHPLFFIALFVICAGVLILLIIRRKNIQIKSRELDHQLITLEQKALQSMMNPHFIFNSLGSIQNYLLQKKSGEAGLYLSQFARLIRQNLNAINAASINLEEEIDRLKNYLDLEKLRMDNKFDYIIDVDEKLEADEILIPSMIIQPFVENAIWHGISTLNEPGLITITFRKKDEKSLKIIVKDNGVGMKKSRSYTSESEKHIHMGIEMTRRRLELLGKKYSIDTSIECCEVSPGLPNPGTRIVLVVPVSYSEAEV